MRIKNFFYLQRFGNVENSKPNKVVSGTSGGDSINNSGSIVTIQAAAGNDTIYNSGSVVKIYAATGNDSVYNYNGNNVSISVAEGDDTVYNYSGDYVSIVGGAGNDTMTGGDGEDVFVHSAGNDFITDYTADSDYIKLENSSLKSSSVSSKNVILKTTTGQITIKDGKGKNISVLITNTYSNIAELISDENNFAQIDSIVEKKFAVADIQTENKITVQDNLITFAE